MSHRYPHSQSRTDGLMPNNIPPHLNHTLYQAAAPPALLPNPQTPESQTHIRQNLFAPPDPQPFAHPQNIPNANTHSSAFFNTVLPLNNTPSTTLTHQAQAPGINSNTNSNWQYSHNNAPNMNRNYSNPNAYPIPQAAFHVGSSGHPNRNHNSNNMHSRGNGSASAYGGQYGHHRSAPDHHQPQPQHQPQLPSGNLTLGDIGPIRDALSGFNDESAIILRFSQFCAGSPRSLVSNRRREYIHSFSGFNHRLRPRVEVLAHLTKSDLDTLIWALGLPRGGRKADITNRIADALKAPLKWRVPVRSQGPSNSHANAIPPSSISIIPTANGSAYNHSTYGGYSSMPAGNMPPMPGYASVAYGQPPRRANPPRKKGRDVTSLIRQSDLMFSETPFNIPISAPLGNPNFYYFSSVQLSNGLVEPLLEFYSPDFDGLAAGDAKGKGEIQVHLRCLKVEPTKAIHEWKQSWPFPAAAKVNEHNVELDQAQRFTNGKLAGVDKATNITRFLRGRRDRHMKNNVKLRRSANSVATANGNFVFFAQPVLVQSMDTMKEIVTDNSRQYWAKLRSDVIGRGMDRLATDYDLGRRQVEKWMSGGDGIAVASQKVSLKCPLSLVPISIPARGKNCSHIQCFDLSNYLDYTRRSRKFKCPVCNSGDASPDNLVISWFFDHALKKYKNCDEIEVLNDGSIKAVENIRSGVASQDSDDDSDDGDGGGGGHGGNGGGPANKRRKLNSTGAPGNTAPASTDVVDLTLDSDDEAPPPPPPVTTTLRQEQPVFTTHLQAQAPPATSMELLTSQVTPPIASPVQAPAVQEEEVDPIGAFDTSFGADDEVYPWDPIPDQLEDGQEEEQHTSRASTLTTTTVTQQEEHIESNEKNENQTEADNNENDNNGTEWNNGIEVICIDSD